MKKLYIIFVFLLTYQMQAQQDPQYTQYMYNMNIVNPAYAGSFEGIAIGGLFRSQWVGLEGAPNTGTIALHAPGRGRVENQQSSALKGHELLSPVAEPFSKNLIDSFRGGCRHWQMADLGMADWFHLKIPCEK